MKRGKSRAIAAVLSLALVSTLVMFGTAGAARADTNSSTGDESVSAPVKWLTYVGTTSQISAKLGSTYRLVDVHELPSGLFTVTAVQNTGSYKVSAWWWYVDQTVPQVSSLLSSNNARLISVEQNAAGTYNVIMVSNTGSAARAWWWYAGASISAISAALSTNNARLVSVDRDQTDGNYVAVMVSNTGSDAKTWWWYAGETTTAISGQLSANGARLVDLSHNLDGTFNAIMVKNVAGTYWKWYVGASLTSLVNSANQTGYRIFDLQPYASGGSTVYAALEIDNLAAENRRVENIFESGYAGTGATYGYYVKPIGSASVLALQNGVKYEPASGIKALYNLYAQFKVQIGDDSLSSPFHYWYQPSDPTNPGVCPLNYTRTSSNEITTTLENGLDQMMQVSDNRATQGVDLRYGRANVNNFAKIIGMSGTAIKQTVGCGILNGGYVTTTLNDLTKLYEGAFNDTLLNSSNSAAFFARMIKGSESSTSAFGQMVAAEAAKLGKSASVTSFLAATYVNEKGGSYDMCFPTGPCSAPYDYVRSNAGVLQLPFKSSPGGSIVDHAYAFGWWVNNLSIPCAFGVSCSALTQADNTTSSFDPEIFRHQVDLALANW